MHAIFVGLDKLNDKVNRTGLWDVLRMYKVDDELLNGIKTIYVISITCVRVQRGWGESESFKIDTNIGQECVLSS